MRHLLLPFYLCCWIALLREARVRCSTAVSKCVLIGWFHSIFNFISIKMNLSVTFEIRENSLCVLSREEKRQSLSMSWTKSRREDPWPSLIFAKKWFGPFCSASSHGLDDKNYRWRALSPDLSTFPYGPTLNYKNISAPSVSVFLLVWVSKRD